MTRRKTIINLLPTIIFFGTIASLIINPAGSVPASDKKLNISNLRILGLDINACTSLEIYSRLGPTTPVRNDVNRLCYVSDRDDTLILFSTRGSRCTGFRILSQKKRFNKWHFCEKSPSVSKYLATAGGIKLGISKEQLKTILGIPESESDSRLDYAFDRDRKITIRAEFSETGMILFDVSK